MKVGLAKKEVKYGALKGASIYLLYVLNLNNMTTSNSEKKQQFVNPFTENFIPYWEEWKYYKKEQHRFTYKPAGEMAAIKRLVKLSRGDEAIAIQMLEEASGNGWKGFFELKTLPNANNISGSASGNQPSGGSSSSARINAVKKF